MAEKIKQKLEYKSNGFTIALFLIFADFLRIYNLTYQPLWSDEIDAIKFSSENFWILLGNLAKPGNNGQLFYLILNSWFGFVGKSTFSLRYLSVLFGVLTVAVAYKVCRKWFDQTLSLFLIVFVGTSPYLVWYSQDGKMYSLLLFVSLLSTLILLYFIETQQLLFLIGYIFLNCIGWYVHLFYVLIIPIHIVIYFTLAEKKRGFWRFLFALFFLILLFFPLGKWIIPMWLSPFQTGHEYVKLMTILKIQLFVFSAGFPTHISQIHVLVFLFLFVFGLLNLWGSKNQRWIILTYFFGPIILLYLISLGMPVYTDRYLIIISPAFYIVCAIALSWLKKTDRFLQLIFLLAVLVLNLSAVAVQGNLIIKGVK